MVAKRVFSGPLRVTDHLWLAVNPAAVSVRGELVAGDCFGSPRRDPPRFLDPSPLVGMPLPLISANLLIGTLTPQARRPRLVRAGPVTPGAGWHCVNRWGLACATCSGPITPGRSVVVEETRRSGRVSSQHAVRGERNGAHRLAVRGPAPSALPIPPA